MQHPTQYERHIRHALSVTTVRNATISNLIISFSLWHIGCCYLCLSVQRPNTPRGSNQTQNSSIPTTNLLLTPTGSTSNIAGSYVVQLASVIKKVHEKGQVEDVGCDEGSGYSHNRKQGFLTAREVNAGVHSLCMTQVPFLHLPFIHLTGRSFSIATFLLAPQDAPFACNVTRHGHNFHGDTV